MCPTMDLFTVCMYFDNECVKLLVMVNKYLNLV